MKFLNRKVFCLKQRLKEYQLAKVENKGKKIRFVLVLSQESFKEKSFKILCYSNKPNFNIELKFYRIIESCFF